MATETWNAEGIHKQTGTRFTPAGYDMNGLDENGFDRWGRDKDGFTAENIDKDGNYRGTGLINFETRILTIIATYEGEAFRKTDVVPGFFRDSDKNSRDWQWNHQISFNSLVANGVIVKDGRRWNLSESGVAKLEEVGVARAANSKDSE